MNGIKPVRTSLISCEITSVRSELLNGIKLKFCTSIILLVVPIVSYAVRVVSLAPNLTEIVLFLGRTNDIIGITRYCPKVKGAEIVGGMVDPDIEKVVALKPDVVLATTSGNRKETVELLRKFGLKVIVTSENTIDDVTNTICVVGRVLGVESVALRKAKGLMNRLNHLAKPLKKLKVMVVLSFPEVYAVGGNTFIDDVIRRAGGVNVFGDSKVPYPLVSFEKIVSVSPDVIIFPTDSDGLYHSAVSVFEKLKIPAVLNGRFYKVDPDMFTRPSPAVFDAVEELNKILIEASK